MDYILEAVPFTNCDEEPRLYAIIEDLIAKGEVPEYKSFTQEDEKKKQRRKRKVNFLTITIGNKGKFILYSINKTLLLFTRFLKLVYQMPIFNSNNFYTYISV